MLDGALEAEPVVRRVLHHPAVRRGLAVIALCTIGLLYTFPYHPKIGNPNEKLRLYMTAAIAEDGSYVVNEYRKRWGWVNDAAIRDGKLYSVKGPATSFLGVPAYFAYHVVQEVRDQPVDLAVAHWLVRFTAVILPVLAFLLCFRLWLSRFTTREWLADAVTLGLALGSPFYAYSVMFVSHSLAAVAVFFSFALLREAAQKRTLSVAAATFAGFSTAAITAFEYPGVLLSLILSGWALVVVRPAQRLAAFVAGALVPTLAVMHFQWAAFGSPFRPGHKMLENQSFKAGHEVGLFGASTPKLEAIFGLTFDPRQGLFPLAPWMLFAFVGLYWLSKRAKERSPVWIAIALCLVLYLFTTSLNIWHAGWSVGPRYLIPLFPLLAWGALVGLDGIADKRPRLAVALTLGTLATGLVASGVPSAYYPHIPVETQRMLRDIFWPAIAHDFAPYNALNLVGVWGTLSMVPFFAFLVGCVLFVAWKARAQEPVSARTFALATLVFALTLLPVVTPPWQKTSGAAHVLRNWSPDDKDRAARLEAELKGAETAEGLRTLRQLYLDEARQKEAKRSERRLRSLEESAP